MSSPYRVQIYVQLASLPPKQNLEEHWKRSSVPLPELQFLNLANNKVCWITGTKTSAMTPFKWWAKASHQWCPLRLKRKRHWWPSLFSRWFEKLISAPTLWPHKEAVTMPSFKSDAALKAGSEFSLLKSPPCLWPQEILPYWPILCKRGWGYW